MPTASRTHIHLALHNYTNFYNYMPGITAPMYLFRPFASFSFRSATPEFRPSVTPTDTARGLADQGWRSLVAFEQDYASSV